MSEYEDATVVRQCRVAQADGGELSLRLLQGQGPARGGLDTMISLRGPSWHSPC